jgi:ribosomal protein S18 acetylase RimI-like enzyme
MAECGDEVVGLILGYSGRTMGRLQLPMAGQMLEVLGVARFMHFLRKALPLRRLKEADGGEYFVNAVAVLPEFQGQGIGSALLEHVEGRAKVTGFRACSLSVEIGNVRACRLYERRGYHVVETHHLREASTAAGRSGVYRMVKAL